MSLTTSLRSNVEERVVEALREGTDELVGIASDLVAFDTTARLPGEPAVRSGRCRSTCEAL